MRRAAAWIALLGAAAGLAFLFVPKEPPPSVPQRPAPAVPKPTPEEKAAYFYALVRGGASVDLEAPLAGATPLDIPVWREIGESALLGLGQPALDFLTSPARYPEYVAAPDMLVAALDVLKQGPSFPGLFPFLAHWLEEGNCPPRATGSDWPDEIRNLVFLALKEHPVPEAVPFCVAEFDRPRRGHDLRGAATDILLRLGEADVLNRVYGTLPPTPEVPEPDLRTSVLERLLQMAAPGSGDRNRRQVERLEPLLTKALESPRVLERLGAMGVLRRLGRPGMQEGLERFFDENERTDERAAWSALLLLAADGPTPFVHEACLRRVERPDEGAGFGSAARLLATYWPDEIAPRYFEWIRSGALDPYLALAQLLRTHREDVVRWLREQLLSPDSADINRTLGFISREGVTELAPELLAKVRELDPAHRPPIYRALVQLRAPATEALLLAELGASIPLEFKAAAAVELLNLGGEKGRARLGELIAAGDGPALDALLRRARALGEQGVPPELAPAVLKALRTVPGEDGRKAALLILRFRGRFDDVRDGLIEAYRHEPSRRVAQEIRETIEELAHR